MYNIFYWNFTGHHDGLFQRRSIENNERITETSESFEIMNQLLYLSTRISMFQIQILDFVKSIIYLCVCTVYTNLKSIKTNALHDLSDKGINTQKYDLYLPFF